MTIETVLPKPDIFAARRVLCVQPHYDDNDIGAGGTLARLQAGGADLCYLTVTNDLMGVVDATLSDAAATATLRRDQFAAAALIPVREQVWLGYPDAGAYDYFELRRHILKSIRLLKPDLVMTVDPWLPYEAHRDHIQTGLATAEAVMFAGLTRIASSDPAVDAEQGGHDVDAIAFYHTREPNEIVDITSTWERKVAAVRCYEAQFSPEGMARKIAALDAKSLQVAQGQSFARGEALKILHPDALHVGT